MGQEERFQEAISNVEQGNFGEALLEFMALYQENFRKEEIKEILDSSCYRDNIPVLQENYNQNKAVLEQYPFISGWNPCAFEELTVLPYMVGNQEFCLYNKAEDCFSDIYYTGGRVDNSACLKQMEHSRMIKNVTDMDQLCYIVRNMRKSEDLARENHVYLYYDKQELLELLMQVEDFTELLKDKKVIIFCGSSEEFTEEQIMQKFNLDYTGMEPKQLELSDIQRMIFGWKIANVSGTSFLADVMDFHPNLLTIPDTMFNDFYPFYQRMLRGKTLVQAIEYLKNCDDQSSDKHFIARMTIYKDKKSRFSEEMIAELNRVTPNQFLDVLKEVLKDVEVPTAAQWMAAIHLAFNRCHDKNTDTSVIPAVFMYPHDDMFALIGSERERVWFYLDMAAEFPDYKVVSMLRDPVTHAGSTTRYLTEGHPGAKDEQGRRRLDPFYAMAFGAFVPKDFYFPLEHPAYEHIRIVRFEDLKMNPEATWESLTEFLDLPMDDILYQSTWCGYSANNVDTEDVLINGYDLRPVRNPYTKYLSVFDKYRIECIMSRFMEHYGYVPQYYDGQNFSNAEILSMMNVPFRCESIETILPQEVKQSSRMQGLRYVQMSLQIRSMKWPFKVNDMEGNFMPLKRLMPKEELLRVPLYTNRVTSCPEEE